MTCLVGASITRLLSVLFSTYLILWIQSFPGLSQDEQSKNIYFNMMIISVVISSIVLPVLGRYIDNCSAIKLVPWAFLMRAGCMVLFYFVKQPDSVFAYTVCVLIIVFTILESNLVDTIFAKSVNKSTRGILFGL